MGGDHHRGAEPVQLHEQAQQAAGKGRIDIARRLVGEQQLGLGDYRAGDRRALFLAARQHRGMNVHPVAEADPVQQFDHVGAVGGFLLADDPERQGDILVGRQMVEQPEILEYHAKPAAQGRQVGARQGGNVVAEQRHQSARRLQCKEQQPHQRCLACAGRAGEELERATLCPVYTSDAADDLLCV